MKYIDPSYSAREKTLLVSPFQAKIKVSDCWDSKPTHNITSSVYYSNYLDKEIAGVQRKYV